MADKDPKNLEQVLDELGEAADDGGKVTIDEAHKAIGERSFGPLLVIPGLVALTPLGVVPGAPTVLAIIVALISGQLVFGRKHFWIPKFIRERSVKAERLKKSVDKARPIARTVDKVLKPRMQFLTGAGATRLVAVLCTLIAFAIPPLELVPFAVFAPAIAITAFGLGLIAKDGLVVLLAIIASVISLGLVGFAFVK